MGRCDGYDDDDLDSEDTIARSGSPGAFGRFSSQDQADADFTLPCRPSTVVYGHAASRDLDIKRWTVGLDTGCLYGHKLTALLLQRADGKKAHDEDDFEEDEDEREFGGASRIWGSRARAQATSETKGKTWTQTVKFGDDSRIAAHVVSVKCPKSGDIMGESSFRVPQISS